MAKYRVVLLAKNDIVVFRGNTTIAKSLCGNLYPTSELKNSDIDTLLDIADYYDLFYIEREDMWWLKSDVKATL